MTMPKREGFDEGPHVLGAVTLLARLVQDALTPRLAEFGLSFAEAVAMVRLWQSPTGSLPQSALIEKLAVSRASGSLVLSDLEQKGFVRRLLDPGDARRQIVELTERGTAIESEVHEAFEDLEGRLFHPIGSESWKTTYRSLRSAIDALVAVRNGAAS
jgi:DNA-binding MarR family transcriptional regulator